MRKRGRFGSLLGTTIAVAIIGIRAFVPAAFAQQPQTTSIATQELFQPDTETFKPGAGERLVNFVKQAQMPGSQCPTDVNFTVFDSGPDPLWSQLYADMRREAIEGVLRGLGPSVRVTAKSTKGIISAVIISTQTATDKEPPKLHTISVPRKGSRVKAGDTIKVTMVARDDANLWQSGIKTIQLVADSEGGRFIASENYPQAPPGCTALPPARRVEATYTVPQNPPPIVRLAALTEDHAGLMDTDVGAFPTQGDWYGRIEWSVHGKEDTSRRPNENRAETKYDGHADLTVTYDGQGNLTGTLVGSQKVDTLWWGFPHGSGEVCKGSAPPTPVRARVVGSYTPGRAALSLQLVDVEAQIFVPWTCSGDLRGGDLAPPIESGPTLSALVRSLQPAGDGTYRAEFTPTDPIHTFRYSLTLRPTAK